MCHSVVNVDQQPSFMATCCDLSRTVLDCFKKKSSLCRLAGPLGASARALCPLWTKYFLCTRKEPLSAMLLR